MDKIKISGYLCKNKYGTYLVPKNHHRPVTQFLKVGRVWEPKTIEFMLKNHQNKSIVTAGTYIGDFLPAFKDIKRVFAFEPIVENFKFASFNVNRNKLTNTILKNLCLSNENKNNQMITSVDNVPFGGGSSVVTAARKLAKDRKWEFEEVKAIKLDSFLKDYQDEISIIQLDVEHHESEVLEGSIETVKKFLPIIIVEGKPNKSVEKILFNLGYQYHLIKLHGNKILYIESKHKLIF